jgi:enoyl-[acyl-carrier protein] reductase II
VLDERGGPTTGTGTALRSGQELVLDGAQPSRFGLELSVQLRRRPLGPSGQEAVGDTRRAHDDQIIDEGIEFVTTSAGSPDRFGPALKASGLILFHVVPNLKSAQRAVDAGVDGLVVEGSEGAGFKNPRDVTTMVLIPLIASKVDVPVVAAGGIADGRSMAAAFALGAEGVQMGTRMLTSLESTVHHNMKQAVLDAAETDTMLVNRHRGKPVRVLRTPTTERFEGASEEDAMSLIGNTLALYERGVFEETLPQLGAVAGRIEEVLSAKEIIGRTMAEFEETLRQLNDRYVLEDR